MMTQDIEARSYSTQVSQVFMCCKVYSVLIATFTGGPGGSGVEMLSRGAAPLRDLLGEGYDFIGFDPRGMIASILRENSDAQTWMLYAGVGATTPSLNPFISQSQAGKSFLDYVPTLNHSDSAFGAWHASAQSLGNLAQARVGNLAQYVSTSAVARDMLGIVKAYGFDKLQYYGLS